ncbi:MAG: phage BR0599 family protein [Puniceicoccaceae bacterium]
MLETFQASGKEYRLIHHMPDWAAGIRITHRLRTVVAEGLTGIQSRRPFIESMRVRVTLDYLPDAFEADELNQLLGDQDLPQRVALPLWASMRENEAFFTTRIYETAYLMNFGPDGQEVLRSDALPTAYKHPFLVPLAFGRLSKRPSMEDITGGTVATCQLVFLEDSPFDLRVRVHATPQAQRDVWPDTLRPDYSEPVRWESRDRLEYEDFGSMRESVFDGEDAPPEWGQEMHLQLLEDPAESAEEVRQLLTFFLGRMGQWRSFSMPVWFRPGADRPTTPHSMRAGFADDEITLDFQTPTLATTTLKLWQRAHETVAIPGEQPEQPAVAFLYRFRYVTPDNAANVVNWRFTDWERDIVTTNGTYTPAPFEIEEGTFELGIHGEFELRSYAFEGSPLMLFIPFEVNATLQVMIYRVDPANVAATQKLVFSGRVSRVTSSGKALTAQCQVFRGLLDRRIPRMVIQPHCNYNVFDRNCGLSRSQYTRTATITGLDGASVTLAGVSAAAGYFNGGMLWVGDGINFESRPVVSQNGNRFGIVKPLRKAKVGDAVRMIPGCDGLPSTCEVKFANYNNFGGAPWVPDQNPTVQAITTETNTRKK